MQQNHLFENFVILAASDRAFLTHRLPMAEGAADVSMKVTVVCADTGYMHEIEQRGFYTVALPNSNFQLISTLKTLVFLIKLYKRERPKIVHHSSVLMSFLGSLASLSSKTTKQINAITGVGYLFTSSTLKARMLRSVLTPVLRWLWSKENSVMLFQNKDDRDLFVSKGLCSPTASIIKGSGVDVKHFKPRDPKRVIKGHERIVIGCATRLLKDKGIEEMIAAVSSFNTKRGIELHIAGSIFPNNPSSFTKKEIEKWAQIKTVKWRGQVDDMLLFWSECDIAILPSHREGLPKALLEAAACGLPLLGANVPGTREIIINGHNGILFHVGNPQSISRAINQITSNYPSIILMGQRSRRLVEQGGFSSAAIRSAYRTFLRSI